MKDPQEMINMLNTLQNATGGASGDKGKGIDPTQLVTLMTALQGTKKEKEASNIKPMWTEEFQKIVESCLLVWMKKNEAEQKYYEMFCKGSIPSKILDLQQIKESSEL